MAGRKKTCLKKVPFNRRINENILNILRDYAKRHNLTDTQALESAILLQAKYFIETNNYIPTKKKLTELLTNEDREILEICIKRENIVKKDLNEIEKLYYKLIQWSSNNI